MDVLKNYLNLSTNKRETSSASTRKRLGIYWSKYIHSQYDISYSGLRDWLIDIPLSNSSKKSISGCMAKMMYVYELITKDEYKRIQDSFKARVPNWSKKVLSDDELIEFFNIIISMKIDKFYVLRNLTLFVLLLITGMRIGQALELTIDDIELTDKYIILNIPTSKKNDTQSNYSEYFTLHIPNTSGYKQINIRNLIEVYLNLRSNLITDGNTFLCTKSGNSIHPENIRNLCRSIKTKTRITPHRFRHTAISNVALNYGITKAAILANHTNINTTKRYVQSVEGDISDVFRKSEVDYN